MIKKMIAISFLLLTGLGFSCTNDTTSDSPLQSTTIAIGTLHTETIPADGFKVYDFTTAMAGYYTIGITNLGSDCGWVLYDYNSTATTVGELVTIVGESDLYHDKTSEIADVKLTTGTRYFLVVNELDSVNSGYDLAVNFTTLQSTTLTEGALPLSDSISAGGAKLYKFTAASSVNYSIRVTNISLGSDLGWTIYTYDPADQVISELTDNLISGTSGNLYTDNSDEIGGVTLDAGVTYYILVEEHLNTDGTFDIQVQNAS